MTVLSTVCLRARSAVPIDYPSEPPPARDKKRILAHAALRLLGQNHFTFTSDELLTALGHGLEKTGYGSAPARPWAVALKNDLINNSGLLRGYRNCSIIGETLHFFLEASIQEYLCACALATAGEKRGL